MELLVWWATQLGLRTRVIGQKRQEKAVEWSWTSQVQTPAGLLISLMGMLLKTEAFTP